MSHLKEDKIVDRIFAERLLATLDEESQFILYHWMWMGLSLEEIGPLFGLKYRGRPLTGGDIRYHKNKALQELRATLGITLDCAPDESDRT